MDTNGPHFFIISSSNLQVTRTAIESRMNSNSGHIRLLTSELPAPEKNFVDTIVPSVLIGSSSNLQIMRTGIGSRKSSISGQNG